MSQENCCYKKPLAQGSSFPLSYSRRLQNSCCESLQRCVHSPGPEYEPIVSAEERMQEQDTSVQILHWNMMALSSVQLINFAEDMRSSLVTTLLSNFDKFPQLSSESTRLLPAIVLQITGMGSCLTFTCGQMRLGFYLTPTDQNTNETASTICGHIEA